MGMFGWHFIIATFKNTFYNVPFTMLSQRIKTMKRSVNVLCVCVFLKGPGHKWNILRAAGVLNVKTTRHPKTQRAGANARRPFE